eukprot:4748290-Amphidinium_carterae.2
MHRSPARVHRLDALKRWSGTAQPYSLGSNTPCVDGATTSWGRASATKSSVEGLKRQLDMEEGSLQLFGHS